MSAFILSTYALSKKMNDYNNQVNTITGHIVKKNTVILAEARGNISKIYFNEGEKVKSGDKLAILTNPDLKSKIAVLSAFTNNESATTELQVASQEAQKLDIYSPVTGYVSTVDFSEGETVNPSDKIYTISTNADTRFYAELTDDEFKKVRNFQVLTAYNERLNQFIELTFANISPDKIINTQDNISKVGVYFKLRHNEDGENLLHNEEMTLILDQRKDTAYKPFDAISAVWKNILNKQ